MNVFPERLKAVRVKQGKTCMDISLDSGLNQNCVFQWERQRRSPNMRSIVKVADCLGVSIDYLVGRTDNPEINR